MNGKDARIVLREQSLTIFRVHSLKPLVQNHHIPLLKRKPKTMAIYYKVEELLDGKRKVFKK